MLKRGLVSLLLLGAILGGCGDDGGGTPDARRVDGRVVDATTVADDALPLDAPPVDATVDATVIDGPIDATVIDAPVDAGVDAAVDATPIDAPVASDQIAAARATADGTGLTLPITGVLVTYVKPPMGTPANDPAGFTIQADPTGPALYIAVDAATLLPPPAVGDRVTFTITTMGTVGGLRVASAITGLTVLSSGNAVAPLAQNVSAATDLVTGLDGYESELIDVTGTVAAGFVGSGTGFERATFSTAGVSGDSNLQLRVAATLRDGLDLAAGCQVTLDDVPVSRFNAAAQLPANLAGDLTVSGCPAPTVLTAIAPSATQVQLTFSRRIQPASVLADGSQFTFDGGLTASAATVSGRTVTVTTSAQTGGITYLATIGAGLTDLQGTALSVPASASFTGFQVLAVARINELNAFINGGCDLIELRVVSGGVLTGFRLLERDTATLLTFPTMTVATNDLIVVHINGASATCNPGASPNETTSVNQHPSATFAANFDTAYDLYSTDTGLTDTDNVFTLYDNLGVIVDAVFASNDPAGPTAATGTEVQAALVGAAAQWSPMLASYIDTVFRTNAVDDLNATGTAAAGTSIQRLDNTDDNNVGDWSTGAGPASTWGAINAGQTAF